MMQILGKRIQITKSIHARMYVVRVIAEAVIPDADPSEPCLEPQTLRWLDAVQMMADKGDVEALAKIGDVYVRNTA